jgi:hypothetical protein
MAADGLLGNGVKVAYSAASPVSWIRVPQVLNVVIPGLEFDEVETTVHSTGGLRRFIPGLGDVTEMELELLADLDETTTASYNALFNFQAARTTIWWRIEVPTTRAQTKFTAFEFQGFVKTWKADPPIDDRQTLMVTVRFDGTSFSKLSAGASAIT